MVELPRTLIKSILSRLPVKSLARFRCVSKPWKSLIDNHDFIKFKSKNSSNKKLVIQTTEPKIFFLDFPTLTHVIKFKFPLKINEFICQLYGSCNGLLCISDEEHNLGSIIFNPATTQFCKVPYSPFDYPLILLRSYPRIHCLKFGFGHEELEDDYRLVRIIQFDPAVSDDFRSETNIYSLKMDLWRRVSHDLPTDYLLDDTQKYGVYLSGNIHWVVSERKGILILTLELRNEIWGEFELPLSDSGVEDEGVSVTLGVLAGCLCIGCTRTVGSEVWVMKKYGAEESWSKLFRVATETVIEAIACYGSKILILKGHSSLCWVDLQTHTTTTVCELDNTFCADLFVESLASIEYDEEKERKRLYLHEPQIKQTASLCLAELPHDLFSNILCRLSAPALLEIKRVCKSWCDTINSPDFIRMHLESFGRNPKNLSLLLLEQQMQLVDNVLNRAAVLHMVDSFKKTFQIHLPLKSPNHDIKILGSHNGLVCLYVPGKEFAIWNPMTSKCHKVVISSNTDKVPSNIRFGFGFAQLSNDYQIIQIIQQQNSTIAKVEVYSLRMKRWESATALPDYIFIQSVGVYAGGALHWLVCPGSPPDYASQFILALDLGSKIWQRIARPEIYIKCHRTLGSLGGSLCLFCCLPKNQADMWMLQDSPTQHWINVISSILPFDCFWGIKPLGGFV